MLLGYKSGNHPQQVAVRGVSDETDTRGTCDEIFLPLMARHQFTLDAAANADNAKTKKYFDLATDGLKQSWRGERVWCNPPFSNLGGWVRKALDEVNRGGCPLVVMLLPNNRMEQIFWQDHIEPVRDADLGVSVKFLRGRPRFTYPAGHQRPAKGDRPPFGVCLVTFTPSPLGDL
jgi:phage N-6-adenine-methyltransferase